MEHNVTTCPACGQTYEWVGYKTGIGKTEAQLALMHDDDHVCKGCGYDDRTGDQGPLVDEISEAFRRQWEQRKEAKDGSER